ncbi:MAG: TolC family protein [Armatimonadota bacterium]
MKADTSRRHRSISILTFALTVFFAATGMAGAEKLTLEQSIAIALDSNPSMHIARENINKADALVREAFSAGLPKLTAGANYQRLDKISTIDLGGGNSVDAGNLDNRTADLVLAQPIDMFGIVKTGRKAAQHGKDAYNYNLQMQTNNTILDVKTAFYSIFRAQQYLKVQEETVAQLEAHLKDAQTNYDAGAIAKFDVLRAETQVANAKQNLISARNGVDLAKSAFNTTLGRPINTEVDLAEPEKQGYINLELAACTETACTSRPEVLSADEMIMMNDQLTKIAKRSTKPSINFRWSYNRNFDTSMFNSRESSWNAILGASMKLYDGGAAQAAVDKSASDTNNAKYTKDQIVLGVTLDTQQAYLSVKESQERINAAVKALEQANESARLAMVRYRGGVSTQLEVLDSETALTVSKTNYVNALYDYQVALAKLERAVGGQTHFAKLLNPEAQPAVTQAQEPDKKG